MLRFNKDGKFKIMQIADALEIPRVSPDTISLIESALDSEKPDLVIFTGDQIKGYSLRYKNHPERVNRVIELLVRPIVQRNIPFMVTYGNHDEECGLTKKEQFEIYKKYKTFLQGNIRDDNDVGTADIQIKSSKADTDAFNIYLFDSHGKKPRSKGYAPVYSEQLEWYEQRREELKQLNGQYVPALAFQHIPVPEIYSVVNFVERKRYNGVPIYGGSHDGEYVRLKQSTIEAGGFMGEFPSPPDTNSGEFDKLSQKGDVIGLYFGHDHVNSFVEKLRNVDLGYTQGCGFNSYGKGENKGVRVFVLDENLPREYKTYTRTFKDLVGTDVKNKFKDFIYTHSPTSKMQLMAGILKLLIVICTVLIAYFGYEFLTGFNL